MHQVNIVHLSVIERGEKKKECFHCFNSMNDFLK